jgi:DNA-binding NtrC family response regulator
MANVDAVSRNRMPVNMVGASPAFRKLENLLRKFAGYDAAVLIEGETGTGKELAARSIHYLSSRNDMPFVPVNCGAIPDNLIENELFGHRRGAFTGASESHHGLIAQASGGSLFLDEIDALSPKGQVTLLRFMQDQEYRPLGSVRPENGDVRIIVASNSDLMALAAEGGFRSDLLFRLRVLSVELPPLRDRQGDVEVLAAYYIRQFSLKYGKPMKTLDHDTLAWMNSYAWPGNVRELEHLIHREFLLSEMPVLSIQGKASPVERRRRSDRRRVDVGIGFGTAKAQVVNDFEKKFLQELLTRAEGNVTRAAQLAGKERRALGKLIKKHGLDRGQGPRPES